MSKIHLPQKTIFAAKFKQYMTISYNWLSEYLPEKIEPGKLANILTSIGLEVESLEKKEDSRGGLEGLLVGEIMSCEKHPAADKLKITTVSTGHDKLLNIVCGAPNVAKGQKVIVAPVGATIYPITGEPIKLKKATIRGVESEGMICAESEIGLGADHDGILLLPAETLVGTKATDIFKPGQDYIFEIGLTPNRMDAMSHLGVAKDICAWLSYHHKKETTPVLPYPATLEPDSPVQPIEVKIENLEACRRYSAASIINITVTDSPLWLQQKLKSIGLKPINNIVDITNFILHETGQPLHAFDADKIKGKKVIVKNATAGSIFKTLDEKERKLFSTDLMIFNAEEPMCIGGVYGGSGSGVTKETKNIFLESAWFNPVYIRRTSLKHDLRTDAASRFEKGTDISNTVHVLRRAALLIKEIAGGKITGEIIDIYPEPAKKATVALNYDYLKKLSGKNYPPADARNIFKSLGFEISGETTNEIRVEVPFSKPDITIPADLVEEIMRIDGLDNIEIPTAIMISPSVEKDHVKYVFKEKLADYLTGLGFYEIFTNSITSTEFYEEKLLASSVKMINSLSADLDMLRPEMIQGGLQTIAHNLNRKNYNLLFFEFGKTYATRGPGTYSETNHLSLYITGNITGPHWKLKAEKTDFYYLKGIIERILQLAGIKVVEYVPTDNHDLENGMDLKIGGKIPGWLGEVTEKTLKKFDIKHPVFYADINWDELLELKNISVEYREISKFPAVTRDLALVVDKNVSYSQIEEIALSRKTEALRSVQLFDVFESEKLGKDKRSLAVSFLFMDETKTLTDKEIDSFMQQLIADYQTRLNAEIRK